MTSLEEALDQHAEPWLPEPGDKLVGTIVAIEMFTGKFGDYPLVVVRQDNGAEISFHAFHAVAKSELARKAPQVGDRLGVKYVGRDDERGYERYTVKVEGKAPPPVDWGSVAAQLAESDDVDTLPPEEGWFPPDDE